MIVVVAMLTAALIVAGVYVWRSSANGLLTSSRRRRVLVTLKTGEAFSGVLFSVDRDAVLLREVTAVAYGPKSEDVPVGGEVLILRADIAYLQMP